MTIEGGCRCGAVRYTIAAKRIDAVYCCHCTDCQRWSGSAFSEQAVIREDAISASGPVIEFTLTTPSAEFTAILTRRRLAFPAIAP